MGQGHKLFEGGISILVDVEGSTSWWFTSVYGSSKFALETLFGTNWQDCLWFVGMGGASEGTSMW